MNVTYYVALTIGLIIAELIYLRIARRMGIVDKPNERSAHTDQRVIRGGGVICWLASAIAFAYTGFPYAWVFMGLTCVAAVSFWDDVSFVPIWVRVLIQMMAVAMLLYGIVIPSTLLTGSVWLVALALLVGVSIINAYNFMDGLNGMTAFYSLVTIGTFWYGLSAYRADSFFVDSLLPFTFMSVLVFSIFNARRKAICFAGDVGSIAIGFIVLTACTQLILLTHSLLPILLLTLYGVDTVSTISHRFYLRQPVLQAHRLHLFQLLVHRAGWSHLRVSLVYALLQLLINLAVLNVLRHSLTAQMIVAAIVLGISGLIVIVARGQFIQLADKKIVDPFESTTIKNK
ncbi:glycosyltransferase family 4 protein [Spirosoma terrae]|uniref:Glycosyltransferase family 4 protein n=1 Tax=Spirosoma terrae TaxID=1968276 RepID=A0A6L9LQP4_9BACT|nr:hypothetical protein [Spirosoma terrae]NDU99299.1 hypothetical protein [Spirosoma terrae]